MKKAAKWLVLVAILVLLTGCAKQTEDPVTTNGNDPIVGLYHADIDGVTWYLALRSTGTLTFDHSKENVYLGTWTKQSDGSYYLEHGAPMGLTSRYVTYLSKDGKRLYYDKEMKGGYYEKY